MIEASEDPLGLAETRTFMKTLPVLFPLNPRCWVCCLSGTLNWENWVSWALPSPRPEKIGHHDPKHPFPACFLYPKDNAYF